MEAARPNLADIIGDAIEIGVVSLEQLGDTSQGTFPPVAAIRTADGSPQAWDFVDTTIPPEDWEDLARKFLAEVDPTTRFVALMVGATLTMDDVTTPALIIEAYELGRMDGAKIAQRYDLTDGLYQHVDNPEILRFRAPAGTRFHGPDDGGRRLAESAQPAGSL